MKLKALWLLGYAVSCSACALTTRSEAVQVRYFSAEDIRPARPISAAAGPGLGLELRLDRVRSSRHLGEEIAYRSSEYEVGYYDIEHWTERPEAYLERALERALFQEQGLKRVIVGDSETLVVELIAFEEVRGPRPLARLKAAITLHDERASQLEQTLTVEKAIPASGPTADPAALAVAALSAALSEAVEKIAQTVTQRLAVIAANEPRASQATEARTMQEPARDGAP